MRKEMDHVAWSISCDIGKCDFLYHKTLREDAHSRDGKDVAEATSLGAECAKAHSYLDKRRLEDENQDAGTGKNNHRCFGIGRV